MNGEIKNMNKTDRKNKTNLVVTWPIDNNWFTIKSLLASNPDFKEITLRVRIDNAVKKEKLVSIIGYKNSGKGRPTMCLAMNPVTKELLNKAYNQDGIQPPENKPINVLDIATTPISTSDTPPVIIPTTNIPTNVITPITV